MKRAEVCIAIHHIGRSSSLLDGDQQMAQAQRGAIGAERMGNSQNAHGQMNVSSAAKEAGNDRAGVNIFLVPSARPFGSNWPVLHSTHRPDFHDFNR